MPCPADALQQRRDRPRGPDLNDEIHAPDIDAELERGSRDERLQLAVLQSLFRVQAFFSRQAAVMTRDSGLAEPFGQIHRQALAEAPRVHEYERGTVLRDQLCNSSGNLFPHLRRHDGFERRGRNLELEVERANVTDVDDCRRRLIRAHEELGDFFDRPLRRRETDALRPLPGERVEASERQGQMATALVPRHGVDLIDNDCPDRA